MRWTVLLSVCLHVISASFDYIYEEHSFMGKRTADVKRWVITSWLYDDVRHFKITFSQFKESFTNIRQPWMKNSVRINSQQFTDIFIILGINEEND